MRSAFFASIGWVACFLAFEFEIPVKRKEQAKRFRELVSAYTFEVLHALCKIEHSRFQFQYKRF